MIPARLQSSRLPRKILADIHGRPMLWHVYKRASQSEEASQVCVATDSDEVYRAVLSWGGQAIMTSPHCTCGTERIASIIEQLDGDIIVNVQGDEPMVDPSLIDRLIREMRACDADMVTPVRPIEDLKTLTSSHTVKVVRGRGDLALYFSRSPVPFVRDLPMEKWLSHTQFWLQIGMYAFTRQVLLEYRDWEETALEKLEKVEQIRFLDHGKRIMSFETDIGSVGVDVPEDLEQVRRLMGSSPSE